MVESVAAFFLVLSATIDAHARPTTMTDAELWTVAIEQVRRDLQVGGGELLILNQTIPTSELHAVRDSTRESHLLDLLRQRNSTRRPISGVRLPPGARLVDPSSVQNWANFSKQFPGAKLVSFSLPAFSQDGNRAILYFSATGGFQDSRGGYLVFEKKQEQWIAVNVFGFWIT